jgi:hypothetical protein
MHLRRFGAGLASLIAAGTLFGPACGQGNGTGSGDASTHAEASASDGKASDGHSTKDVPSFSDAGCVNGAACGDGGICAGGKCCASRSACGKACCGTKEVCSFQECVTPGVTCKDSSDCPTGQYCEYSLGSTSDGGVPEAGADSSGCVGGAAVVTGRCLPAPPVCAADAGTPDSGALTCLEECQYHPPTAAFAPTLAYAWGGEVVSPFSTDVMMAPIVLPLEDTNCDGKVNERDIPDIVFTSFTGGAYTTNGTLHAIAVRSGKLVDRWAVPSAINPAAQLAGGDIDGKPGNEVVACGADGAVHAYHGDGSPYWTSAKIACDFPSIADLDGSGFPDVIVEGGILDGATGATKVAKSFGTFVVSDIDGDGKLDIVSASQGFHSDGTLFVDTATPGDWPAIGDFDKDGKPEVVAVYYATHTVSFWHYDAMAPAKFSWVRQGVDINGTIVQHCPVGSAGYTQGGGPPTVADFNGDGTPDVALAGGIGYCVIDGKKVITPTVTNPNTIMWTATTTDCSSAATGSSIFDFNGDGIAEALYSDEEQLRVYQGPTGTVIFNTCNTTGTLEEFPLVADVDNDGHADIVVVSNAYASGTAEYQCNDGKNIAQSGVRVFSDPVHWVRTRAIWNEHPYHITNVNDDGTIPAKELPNWTQPGLNNFRQNKQPGGEFAAPDAVVSLAPGCGSPFSLEATVRNIGQAALPAGVIVGFYAGKAPTGTKLGSLATLLPLYPAESETLVLPLASPPAGVVAGTTPVYAVVDDTTTPHPSWHECRTDNDTSADVGVSCSGPK